MSCYFVARILIHDEAEYNRYLETCDEVFARFSGRYLAVDRAPVALEGTPEDADTEDEADEELATQVRGSYFYKQSQVSVRHLRELLGKKVFNNPKDVDEVARLLSYASPGDSSAIAKPVIRQPHSMGWRGPKRCSSFSPTRMNRMMAMA